MNFNSSSPFLGTLIMIYETKLQQRMNLFCCMRSILKNRIIMSSTKAVFQQLLITEHKGRRHQQQEDDMKKDY